MKNRNIPNLKPGMLLEVKPDKGRGDKKAPAINTKNPEILWIDQGKIVMFISFQRVEGITKKLKRFNVLYGEEVYTMTPYELIPAKEKKQ